MRRDPYRELEGTKRGGTPAGEVSVVSGPTARRLRAKRCADLLLAVPLLVVVSPLLLVLGLCVRLTSAGPAFFRQTRIGYRCAPFVMYKFRTMRLNAPEDLHREYIQRLLTEPVPPTGGERNLYKLQDDPRVTAVGRFLRRTSLDELPQLMNVIRGQMSLVGPRPMLLYEVELVSDAYRTRFLVPPGITGLWQTKGRNTVTMQQAFDLDVEYVARQCFKIDLLILLRTVPVVLLGKGAE